MSEKSAAASANNTKETTPTPAGPSSAAGGSKKTHRSVHKLNQYNRIKIMNHMMDNGCDAKSCSNVARKFKITAEDAERFVNDKARAAQNNVHEECDSICYKNISNWLGYYKGKNYNNECNYESALIMIAIADMEHHPDPKETGGVDFQSIYRFLGDVMLGNPTADLNKESKEYLGEEFENLISMANTAGGDEAAKQLHACIELKTKQIIPEMSSPDKKHRKEFRSLDPMGIDKFISSTKHRDKKPT